MTNDLHATTGAASTSSDKHQCEKDTATKLIPLVEIVGAVPGCRDDRDDLE